MLQRVESVVRKYYPEATIQISKNEIKFEYLTREFVVHNALKTGERQAPSVTRGPSKGGILGSVTFRPGKWLGAAVVPQTFNKRYFSIYLMAPYDEVNDFHLYSRIYSPSSGSKKEFFEDITKLINSLGKQRGR